MESNQDTTENFADDGDESGSVYETSSNEEQDESQSGVSQAALPFAARSISRRNAEDSGTNRPREELSASKAVEKAREDEKIREEAVKWASTFQAPLSPRDITTPPRKASGSRSKRKAQEPLPEKKLKRLASSYNNEYRLLLNAEIHEAAGRENRNDSVSLKESQIGSSTWTAQEKDAFFSGLGKLGRDNVVGIAQFIRSKSELEVQEYIRVLYEASNRRATNGRRYGVLDFVDQPIAFEISSECDKLLERAGDALAARQELHEIEVEKAKWDGSEWLLTEQVGQWVEVQRKNEEERAGMEEVLPAVNLFILKNWLELSRNVFMNAGQPHEEDNWHALGDNEAPAIRTTAFQDFHSLIVGVTKRLVSATLFCTMSRQKASQTHNSKHADVNTDDVEAAVKILGLPLNSHDFWIDCPKKCSLEVVDDESLSGRNGLAMTYAEFKLAMTKERPSHESTQETIEPNTSTIQIPDTQHQIDSEDLDSDVSSNSEYPSSGEESVKSTSDDGASGFSSSYSRREATRLNKSQTERASEEAAEEYFEATDLESSRKEETLLWKILRQDPSSDLTTPLNIPKRPKTIHTEDAPDWRYNTEYWSQWELFQTPVPAQSFRANQQVRSRNPRKVREDSRTGETGIGGPLAEMSDNVDPGALLDEDELMKEVTDTDIPMSRNLGDPGDQSSDENDNIIRNSESDVDEGSLDDELET